MTTSQPAILADMAGEFCGSAELETLFGVSRQRVYQLTQHPTFPTPVAELAMGKVWRTADVRRWAEQRGRDLFD